MRLLNQSENRSERKRSRMDLIVDILKIINEKGGKIKPTHLMYKANLSHSQMKIYLEELTDKDMIKKSIIENGKKFKENRKEKSLVEITDKGRDFLIEYSRVKKFEDAFGL